MGSRQRRYPRDSCAARWKLHRQRDPVRKPCRPRKRARRSSDRAKMHDGVSEVVHTLLYEMFTMRGFIRNLEQNQCSKLVNTELHFVRASIRALFLRFLTLS